MNNNNEICSRRSLVTTEKAVIHATDMFGYGSVGDAELTSRWSELDKGRFPSFINTSLATVISTMCAHRALQRPFEN
ncbi:hypothetical protein J6590_063455 [Homalodisca vitripennis]|nr:hypothetical protein J6590_063455 [Homalodisca vitripennis]